MAWARYSTWGRDQLVGSTTRGRRREASASAGATTLAASFTPPSPGMSTNRRETPEEEAESEEAAVAAVGAGAAAWTEGARPKAVPARTVTETAAAIVGRRALRAGVTVAPGGGAVGAGEHRCW
ncbi:hypothetical protein GCM10017744_030570 [Streptomyces antimycoticus]